MSLIVSHFQHGRSGDRLMESSSEQCCKSFCKNNPGLFQKPKVCPRIFIDCPSISKCAENCYSCNVCAKGEAWYVTNNGILFRIY